MCHVPPCRVRTSVVPCASWTHLERDRRFVLPSCCPTSARAGQPDDVGARPPQRRRQVQVDRHPAVAQHRRRRARRDRRAEQRPRPWPCRAPSTRTMTRTPYPSARAPPAETTTRLPTGVTAGAGGTSCSSRPLRGPCRRGSRPSRRAGRGRPPSTAPPRRPAASAPSAARPRRPTRRARPACGPFCAIRPTRAASGLRSENDTAFLVSATSDGDCSVELGALEAARDADAAAGRDEPRAVEHAVVRPDAHHAAVATGAGGVLRTGPVAARGLDALQRADVPRDDVDRAAAATGRAVDDAGSGRTARRRRGR